MDQMIVSVFCICVLEQTLQCGEQIGRGKTKGRKSRKGAAIRPGRGGGSLKRSREDKTFGATQVRQ